MAEKTVDEKFPDKFRLPDETKVEAVYKAATGEWIVCMTIGDKSEVVTGASIHYAISLLGNRWRRREKRREAKDKKKLAKSKVAG